MNRKELEVHLRDGRAKLAHKRQSDRDKLRAENDTRVRELRADNARLRALLQEVVSDPRRNVLGDDWWKRAKAALEPKP
jgi:uncharacterized membrane protein